MTDDRIRNLIDNAKKRIKEEGPSYKSIAKNAKVRYNSVKGFLDKEIIPQLDTFFRILLAAGLSPADVEVTNGRLIQVTDEELWYLRMYKRLDETYQSYVKTSIVLCTTKQEEDLNALPDDESVVASRRKKRNKDQK